MTAPVIQPRRQPAPAPAPHRPPRPRLVVARQRAVPLREGRRSTGPAKQGAQNRRLSAAGRLAVAAMAATALCLFGVVTAHVVLTQNQFRLDHLQERSAAGQATYDRLRLRVAELEAPERVVAEAEQRLGMVIPPAVVYLAPSQEESDPSARNSPEADAPLGAAAAADTGWSTVKPHLAED